MNGISIHPLFRYLLSPEDTSDGILTGTPKTAPAGWPLIKLVLWIALGVLSAMAVGQL
jgi:hypothetical protein